MRQAALLLAVLAAFGFSAHQAGAQTGCAMKGNIGENGTLYFTPNHPSWGKFKANRKGERPICSEAEAQAAGFAPAGRPREGGCVRDETDNISDPATPWPDCAIKGSSTGICHAPGGACYAETNIHELHRRERWFYSTSEAGAAGFRRSRICWPFPVPA
ncbi:MAG TPA: hypothetical protein PKE65_00415 [Rhizobiaceae bacterium]|nr:hypothetical protein [Rhizobiaceae bacterium]